MIRLSKSALGEAEQAAAARVLDRAFLGMGPEVQAFEAELSAFFGRPAVCTATGTAALQLALQATGMGRGDEVLVPSLTYVASFQAIAATGATPVACDVDPATALLDNRDAEARITERTRAIMPVHYSGDPDSLPASRDLAARYGLRLVEDAAHAFGSRLPDDTLVGATGDVACFSFDGIKNITSGEGGCVVSDDPAVLQTVRDARLLGVERDTEQRFRGERSWAFDVRGPGWRYHMSDLMAAIGRAQLAKRADMAELRCRLARRYDAQFAEQPSIQPFARAYDRHVPHIYPVCLPAGTDRDALRQRLSDAGVQTGVHYQPNHVLTYFRDPAAAPLPATEALYARLLTLPLHADLDDADVDRVVQAVREAL